MRGLVFACLLLTLAHGWKTYDNYRVYRVTPATEAQLHLLVQWCEDYQLDVWREARVLGDSQHVMVAPEQRADFLHKLTRAGLTYSVYEEDVGIKIAAERAGIEKRRAPDGTLVFDKDEFNTYSDIMAQLDVWEAACPAGLTCSVATLGQSYEGRYIKSFTFSSGAGRQEVWIDSLIHSREWTAGSTVLYMIDNIIENYGSDTDVTNLLDSYDWVFVPVMNPDGYEVTWDDDRMWRKNREPNDGSACIGTDLNRNYDTGYWGWSGTSDSECSDTYGGPSAGSAPETQIIQDEVKSRSSDIFAFVSIHCAAEMWLHSWGQATVPGGNQCDISEHEDHLQRVGDATIAAIEETPNRPYPRNWRAGSVCTTIYPASGGTVDYAHSQGIKYSFTPELSGEFRVDAVVIPGIFTETWNGIIAMVAEIEDIEGGQK